jgi:phage terminase small subunit
MTLAKGVGIMKALTAKQQRFVEEYLCDLNATQAALRAGYSAKTAHVIGHENLRKPEIRGAVDEAMKARSERVEVTADRVLEEYAKLAFVNMMDFIELQPDGYALIDLSRLTRDQAAAIQEFTTDEYVEGTGEDARKVKKIKFKLVDKKSALDSCARHLGMFNDKLRLPGGGVILNINTEYQPPQKDT